MERFDWQTEEEGPIAPTAAPASAQNRPKWTAVLIVAGLLGVAVLVVWQLGRQAANRDRMVREDVRAAFGLWRQAAAGGDEELLGTLLLGGDAYWTATQRELLLSGRLLDRQAIGLSVISDPGSFLNIEPKIEVSDDWRAAAIYLQLNYLPSEAAPPSGVVTLEQTVSLVREGSRWLLRPPDDEFWGVWRTMAGEVVSLTYRDRDAAMAERFFEDLDRDLGLLCAANSGQGTCPKRAQLQVRLESDPAILLKPSDQNTPSFSGRTFLLPTPTLVGNPINQEGYQVLYQAYAGPIVNTFESSLATPLQLPAQDVAMLCFSQSGHIPRFYIYEPAEDDWSEPLEDSAFRFLAADQNDAGIALRQLLPGEPNRLRVLRWLEEREMMLHDETYPPLTAHNIGWLSSPGDAALLLASFRGTMRIPSYQLFDFSSSEQAICSPDGCDFIAPRGFPTWSSNGKRNLLLANGRVVLPGEDGQDSVDLGEGYSPFWMDEKRFGFVRPLSAERPQVQEIVTGLVGHAELTVLWRSDEFDLEMADAVADTPFYIRHVEPLPGEAAQLLLYGRQYAGESSKYIYLTLPLDGLNSDDGRQALSGPARPELVLDRTPAEFPSAADPNGHVPFVISPKGRWLTAAHLIEQGASAWLVHMVEIGTDRTFQSTIGYPGYSFSHPFLDWSAGDRWMLLIDREFIRLLAPEAGFERIIAHDKKNCAYPAWIHRHSNE